MKFRLLDKGGENKVHDGVMMRHEAPSVISWGSRAFALRKLDDETAVYVEVDCFRIGSFG